MRDIIKNIQLLIDGKPVDFRLTKLDAFSGAALMQMLARLPAAEVILPKEPEGDRKALGNDSLVMEVFTALSSGNLRSLMTACLNRVEVLLPAGYQPVMQGSSWSWPDLEHDAATCLKLTLEEALWTLSGFFGEGGSTSRSAEPISSPSAART